MTDARYPIGKFQAPESYTAEYRAQCIATLAQAPARYRAAVAGWTAEQLDNPYREGGWTVRQLIHHVADSHLTIYYRVRFALTVDAPPVPDFDEVAWAELDDARSGPLEPSFALLDGVHARLCALLESLTPEQWLRTYVHSKYGPYTIEKAAGVYAWHSDHHLAHIRALTERMGW